MDEIDDMDNAPQRFGRIGILPYNQNHQFMNQLLSFAIYCDSIFVKMLKLSQ